jgi:pathogenesis-related protein 1
MRMRKATLLIALVQLMLGPVLVHQGIPGLVELEAATLKPSTGLSAGETGQVLVAHNNARAKVGTQPLVSSRKLASYAQQWANHLASSGCRMEHRPSSGKCKQKYGENLFRGAAGYYGVADAVEAWENEKSAYGEAVDISTFQSYGHYTQLVWANTKSVGCSKAECGVRSLDTLRRATKRSLQRYRPCPIPD